MIPLDVVAAKDKQNSTVPICHEFDFSRGAVLVNDGTMLWSDPSSCLLLSKLGNFRFAVIEARDSIHTVESARLHIERPGQSQRSSSPVDHCVLFGQISLVPCVESPPSALDRLLESWAVSDKPVPP